MNMCATKRPPSAHNAVSRAVFHLLVALYVVGLQLAAVAWISVASSPARAADKTEPLRIVAFGDSLMAGFQLPMTDAFPARLEAALKAKGHSVEVANAGVSGDTSAAGVGRLDWAVPDGTHLVILELGANDMLRGLDPAATKRNLDGAIRRIKAKGAAVLLAGMRSVGNWGPDYVKNFEAIYPDLARAHDVPLYPFFLDGVAGRADLNLADGMHPNTRGVDAIVAAILPSVEAAIAKLKAARG